jgi:hypothetical protein
MPVRTVTTIAAALLCTLALQGCAVVFKDPRDAPWDPKPGQVLFDQLPPWQGASHQVCCSVLSRDLYLKARCDTDRPVAPRSNRC